MLKTGSKRLHTYSIYGRFCVCVSQYRLDIFHKSSVNHSRKFTIGNPAHDDMMFPGCEGNLASEHLVDDHA